MKKVKVRHYSGIGGQAVLEGVMMKNSDRYAVAVRRPDGSVAVEVEEFRGIGRGKLFMRIPFIRGFFIFLNSLILGMKALDYSSSVYEEEEGGESTGSKVETAVITAISVALAVFIFLILPYMITEKISVYMRNASLLAILEGAIRIGVFILYILAISLMKDIRRLFRYHGAEHKCINCIETGHELNVENVMRASRLHRRCGSSFILFVMVVSIVVFFFIRVDSLWLKVLLRILLIPVISGISYELIALSGRSDMFIVRLLSAPGLLLQRLTTREPDERMVEVAIRSVEAVFDWRSYLKDAFGIIPQQSQ